MGMFGVFLLLCVNFGISALNAWSCGKSAAETKAVGGLPRFMWWMGAIMSACGFTWCYTLVLGYGAYKFGYLTPSYLEAMYALGYLTIVGPVIGSGFAITAQSWAYAWRERSLANAGVAGWNTFAQVYNTYNALQHIPGAFGTVVEKLFSSKSSDKDGAMAKLVVLLVVFAVLGGVLTTYSIVQHVAGAHARDFAFRRAAA